MFLEAYCVFSDRKIIYKDNDSIDDIIINFNDEDSRFGDIDIVKAYLTNNLVRGLTTDEIARYLKISVIKAQAYENMLIDTISMNTKVGDDEDQEFSDFIANDSIDLDERVIYSYTKDYLSSILGCLQADHRAIIELRFGIIDGIPRTLDEVVVELYKLGLKPNVVTR